MSFRSVLGGLALTALVSGVAGCGDDKDNFIATSSNDSGQKIRVIGRVLNGQTFGPVGAKIEICGLATGFCDAGGVFVIDIPGNIRDNRNNEEVQAGLSNGLSSIVSIRVTALGMATQVFAQDFANDESIQSSGGGEQDPGASSLSYMDIGTIEMNTGFSQRIVVTSDGAPLPSVAVAVIGDDFAPRFGAATIDGPVSQGSLFEQGTCSDSQSVTTDPDGVATFPNLDPFRRYGVIVPGQNIDNVPGFDFGTVNESFSVQGSGAVYALDVDTTRFFDGNVIVTDDRDLQFADISVDRGVLSTVTSSGTILLDSFGGVNGTQSTATALNFSSGLGSRSGVDGGFDGEDYITSANGAVSMLFQTPVTIIEGAAGREVSFRYFENMSDPANTATFNKLNVITGTASSLTSALGTLWTFTPRSAMPAYTPYTIEFLARNNANQAQANAIGRTYMRIPTVATGLSSTINVTADNYNGTTGGTGGSSRVYLDFDRIVRGSVQVIEVTTDGVLNSLGTTNPLVFAIENQADSIVNNITAATSTDIGDLGATAGIRFRVDSLQSTPDNRTGFINTVRVAIVAQDIDGNELDTILDLPVR